MRRVVALLAAALLVVAASGCGGDGAEPGAPEGATLVLDFQPNAVHAGIYAARMRGFFEDAGLDLEIREPSATADGAKLLQARRADLAIMDVNDFGIARERGLDLVAIAAIVQRPLAAVIAAPASEIRRPADLAGTTVGVTGVPSDDAVLRTVLAAAGLDVEDVDRQTIGFESVPLLAAGKVDAATAFWNAEGVELQRRGAPTREFRVDEFGAPRYPELVLAVRGGDEGSAPGRSTPADRETACAVRAALDRGYSVIGESPDEGLDALLDAVPELDWESQWEQFTALMRARAFAPQGQREPSVELNPRLIMRWLLWATEKGILEPKSSEAVAAGFAPRGTC